MTEKITINGRIASGLFLIFLTSLFICTQAQSVKRQCISSYGAVVTTENITFMQTVGQAYNTEASIVSPAVLQGFQQPNVITLETMHTDFLKNLNVTAYPNPATYSITIQSSESFENTTIKIISVNGAVVLNELIKQQNMYTIDCSDWDNGMYIVTINENNQILTSLKLTINK